MRQAWLKALLSHALVQPASLALIWPVNTRLGVEHLLGTPFPSFAVVMVQLTLYYFIESTLFYWSHRLLHKSKFLYRTIHKQHHEFIVSTSLCAEYSHPVEAVFTNYIPFLAGPWLWPPHALTYLAWLALRILQTLDAHSGYQLPFSPWRYIKGAGAAHHDFHHSHPHAGNYGSGIWDSFMGTEKEFWRWQAEQRTKHEETILRKEQYFSWQSWRSAFETYTIRFLKSKHRFVLIVSFYWYLVRCDRGEGLKNEIAGWNDIVLYSCSLSSNRGKSN